MFSDGIQTPPKLRPAPGSSSGSCQRVSRPVLHHAPLRESGREAPACGFRPRGSKTGTQPHPVFPHDPCARCGGPGPRNNLDMGEAAPSAWQGPLGHPGPHLPGSYRGSRPLEGALRGARLTIEGPTTLWPGAPTSLRSSLIPTAQKGYRSPCPAWVQFTNSVRFAPGPGPALLGVPVPPEALLCPGPWGPPCAR